MTAQFEQIWTEAKAAAQAAAEAQNAKITTPEYRRGFDCGFAWVCVPGNIPFGRWAKKAGVASKAYPSGLQIWYSKLHNIPTQSVSVHQAAAQAASEVLQRGLGTSLIYSSSRLD